MPFLRLFPAKLAVAAAAGFVLTGCMTSSRIPAPVEHRDSQQAKGIVVDSPQVALDSKQPGQADYRLAETPQSGARGQWPPSRIAATDPNNPGGLRQPGGQAPFVGAPRTNDSVAIAPAQNPAVTQANGRLAQSTTAPAISSTAPTISRSPVNTVPRVTKSQQPGPAVVARTSAQTASKPKAITPRIADTNTPSQPKTKQPVLAAKQTTAKQSAPKETAKVAMADKPGEAKPAVKKPTPKTVASVDSKFIWPAHGALVQRFADKKSMGIGISGRAGDRVNATADGEVIFSGLGPRGYGKLLIVKHNPELLSVYAHNRNLLVKEGQEVRQGQKIAELGSTGTDRPKLHFEIRRQGKPVDPLAFLPQRK